MRGAAGAILSRAIQFDTGNPPGNEWPLARYLVGVLARVFPPDLVDRVAAILQEAGMEAHHLKLEIGETVLMEDPDHHMDLISRLTDLGVQVQIDKYGTGYSSLNYLTKCRVDTLKIDSSFTHNLGGKKDRKRNNGVQVPESMRGLTDGS